MTTTDLALIDTSTPTGRALALVEPAYALVEKVCKTNFVPQAYRGKPDEALACILTGDTLGLEPMVALREIVMIQGTPALSAKIQRAIIQAHGHKMWLEESTADRCVMAGHRSGEPEHVQRVTWTMDRAKLAGLAGKENWRKNGQSMLVARATGELSRLLASDALAGLGYNAEEVRDGTVDEDGWEDLATEAPEGAAPPPAKTTKRSAKTGSQRKAAQAPHRQPGPTAATGPVETPLPPLPGEDEAPATADLAPERDVEHRRSDAIRIRTEEILGQLERDDRLAFWSASAQRAIGSGLDLTQADADLISIDLDLIEAGEQAWLAGKIVATQDAELVDDQAEDSPSAAGGEEAGWSAEDWKRLRSDRGLSHAELIKLAQGLGLEVSTVPQIVELDADGKARLRAAVEAS